MWWTDVLLLDAQRSDCGLRVWQSSIQTRKYLQVFSNQDKNQCLPKTGKPEKPKGDVFLRIRKKTKNKIAPSHFPNNDLDWEQDKTEAELNKP